MSGLGFFVLRLRLARLGVRTLSFWEFKDCEAPKFFGKKNPIANRRWIANMENAQLVSFCPEGSKVGFASSLLRVGARDWRKKDGHPLGIDISWVYFVSRSRTEFAPAFEVKQLVLTYPTKNMSNVTGPTSDKCGSQGSTYA